MDDTTRPRSRRVGEEGGSPQPPPLPSKGRLTWSDVHLAMPGSGEVPGKLWGYLVSYARHYRGLTQLGLARAAEVSQQTISKVESGEICPHDSLKVRIAQALDVPTAVLFPWPSQLVQTHSGAVVWPVLVLVSSPGVSDA